LAEGFIPRNPCGNIIIPKKNELKKEIEVFTKEDLNKMITFEYDHPIKHIVLVALSTGMRVGEVLALKWEDLDFNSMEITINKTLTCYIEIKNGKRHVKKEIQTPKTKNSIRTIPLPTSIVPILEKARKNQLLNEINLGNLYNKDNKNYIFLTKSGNFYHKSWVNKSWGDFLKKCKVEHKKFHTLRHTYATLQSENDMQLKTVSSLLGHSSINITADIYTHVLKKQKEKAVDIINVLNMC
jgi:integrase